MRRGGEAQVVRTMEAGGHQVEKERYKRLFAELCRQEEADGGRDGEDAVPSSGEQLERFKFWLGLPNEYYKQH